MRPGQDRYLALMGPVPGSPPHRFASCTAAGWAASTSAPGRIARRSCRRANSAGPRRSVWPTTWRRPMPTCRGRAHIGARRPYRRGCAGVTVEFGRRESEDGAGDRGRDPGRRARARGPNGDRELPHAEDHQPGPRATVSLPARCGRQSPAQGGIARWYPRRLRSNSPTTSGPAAPATSTGGTALALPHRPYTPRSLFASSAEQLIQQRVVFGLLRPVPGRLQLLACQALLQSTRAGAPVLRSHSVTDHLQEVGHAADLRRRAELLDAAQHIVPRPRGRRVGSRPRGFRRLARGSAPHARCRPGGAQRFSRRIRRRRVPSGGHGRTRGVSTYRGLHPDGCGYTQFCHHYHEARQHSEGTKPETQVSRQEVGWVAFEVAEWRKQEESDTVTAQLGDPDAPEPMPAGEGGALAGVIPWVQDARGV